MSEITILVEERILRIGDIDYSLLRGFGSDGDDRPLIVKTPTMMARYLDLFAVIEPQRIVEIGVFSGSSTAAISQICPEAELVALELEEEPAAFLTEFIESTGCGHRLRPHYGVDQSDADRVRQIVRDEFGDRPLDLVIDDASHALEPTRASFEVLFPLLREGGVYVIEDWELHQRFALAEEAKRRLLAADRRDLDDAGRNLATLLGQPPLLELAVELLLATASSNEYVAGIRSGEYMFEVVRGAAPLDPATFRVADICTDHLDIMGRASRP